MFRKFCLKSSSEQIFSRKLPLGAPDTLLLLFHFDELQTQGYISIHKTLKNEKYNRNVELFFSHVTFSSDFADVAKSTSQLHPTPLRGRTCTRPIHFKRAPVSVASL